MKLIKPKLISGEIMTLIEEADEKLIIISPYYNISKWDKLLNTFKVLKKKKVEVEFYVRERELASFNEIKGIGFTPVEISNLHTKLYLNEKYGIVSSMNLNVSSDTNSLDIAYKTETKEEYAELFEYYERYIRNHSNRNLKDQEKIKIEASPQEALIQGSLQEFNAFENLQPFSYYEIKDDNIDWSNWKEIVSKFIKEKMDYKYADYYFKHNVIYFKNGSVTFGCYFHTCRKVNSFITKLSCAHNFHSEFLLSLLNRANVSGAKINVPNLNKGQMDIFISMDQELASTDFGFVKNEDIPIILKTLSCSLYVLAYYNSLLDIKSALKRKAGIMF